MTVTTSNGVPQREARLLHWQQRAEALVSKGHALEALADAVEQLQAPVSSYQQTWDQVAVRLRDDALRVVSAANDAVVRATDIKDAMRAREAWIAEHPKQEAPPDA